MSSDKKKFILYELIYIKLQNNADFLIYKNIKQTSAACGWEVGVVRGKKGRKGLQRRMK